ncbi:MAG: metallophosphoesterase family protein [Alistipes sp.]|jgi:putative phosphoesterase|nr:metallophosphoesterase family protein [Alistipes sp.]MBO7242230.1 metallophosphoesterase family protein [Alistipes sp.]
MKIGVISDTHNTFDTLLEEFLAPCDEVWHAGDFGSVEVADRIARFKPLRGVYGNIDGGVLRRMYNDFTLFEVEGVKVLMTHIGGYPRHYSPKALQHIHISKPKLFIAGHSHILKVIYDPVYDLLHINPGAAGKYGIHTLRTAIRFDIEAGEIKNLEIGEWSK